MDPIIVRDCQILGKVIGVFRFLNNFYTQFPIILYKSGMTCAIPFLYSTLLLYLNDVGVKSPNYDALRIVPCVALHNPPNYSHIVDCHPTFRLILGRIQGLSSTYKQAHVDLDL